MTESSIGTVSTPRYALITCSRGFILCEKPWTVLPKAKRVCLYSSLLRCSYLPNRRTTLKRWEPIHRILWTLQIKLKLKKCCMGLKKPWEAREKILVRKSRRFRRNGSMEEAHQVVEVLAQTEGNQISTSTQVIDLLSLISFFSQRITLRPIGRSKHRRLRKVRFSLQQRLKCLDTKMMSISSKESNQVVISLCNKTSASSPNIKTPAHKALNPRSKK